LQKNNQGHYVYTESSQPRIRNDDAKLLTPKLRPGTYCVKFAYHMYGTSVGNIEVIAVEAPSNIPVREWRQDGSQGNRWHTASFEYDSANNAQSVRFVFQSQIGNGFSSDVAIDDIVIESGSCLEVTTTPSTTPAPVTTVSRGSLPSSKTLFPTLHH